MRAFVYSLSLVVMAAGCGKVKEKEVKLEMLPEGETNASYTSTQTSTETDTETDTDTDTTVTLTPLQTIEKDIDDHRTVTTCYTAGSTNSAGCALTTPVQVVDAIVVAAKPCIQKTATNGTKRCTTSSSQATIDAARPGMDWVYLQELDGGGMLLNPYGWTTSTTASLAVGDKVSFTGTWMRFFYGRGYLFKIDESTLTVGKATVADLFKLSSQAVDLGAMDLSTRDGDNFYRLATGYFKVLSNATTIAGDSNYFSLATKTSTSGTELYLRSASTTTVKKDSCYQGKNLSVFWNTTPTPNSYLIDIKSYDVTDSTYALGSIAEVDCTVAGL